MTETCGEKDRKGRGRLALWWVSLLCLVVGVPSGVYLWRAGTRVHPRIDPVERWEVVLEPAGVEPEAVVAAFEFDEGTNSGFVMWRSRDGTFVRRGLDGGIAWYRWPKKTIVQLSEGEPVSGEILDTLLRLRVHMAGVPGRRARAYGASDYLVYMRQGKSEWKFYLAPHGNPLISRYPEWRGTFMRIARDLW